MIVVHGIVVLFVFVLSSSEISRLGSQVPPVLHFATFSEPMVWMGFSSLLEMYSLAPLCVAGP